MRDYAGRSEDRRIAKILLQESSTNMDLAQEADRAPYVVALQNLCSGSVRDQRGQTE